MFGQSIADKDNIVYQAHRTRLIAAAEDKVVLLERQLADVKHEAHVRNVDYRLQWDHREGSHHRRIENVKRAAERATDRRMKAMDSANLELKEKVDYLQRELEVSHPFDTFMGMLVADATEAMLVADELGRAVRKYTPGTFCDEIADRFLKLRKPPAPKSRSRVKALTNYFCPVCDGVAKKTHAIHGSAVKPYFCPKKSCAWEGEA